MKSLFATLTTSLLLAIAPATAVAQNTEAEQLATARRDQQAILRKAERLRDLMTNLRARYAKEERKQYVDLLDRGIAHLKSIGLVETVASVRDALDASAMAKANQKANQVIRNLEQLLQILLDRPSMEKIEEEIEKTKELELSAAALAQRQTELLDKNRETSKQSASATERKLTDRMQDLAKLQEEEAQQNMREAGTRQPFLEDALERVKALLRAQKNLESVVQQQRDNPDQRDPGKQQAFELGALRNELMQQLDMRSKQRAMERIAEAARDLQAAAKRQDRADMEDAKDALRSEMSRATEKQDQALADQIDALLKELEANTNADDADQTGEMAKQIEDAARRAAESQKRTSDKALAETTKRAARTSEKLDQARKDRSAKPGRPEHNLRQAAKALQDAGKQTDDTQQTMAKLSQALRKLAEARAGILKRNPSPEIRAGKMATEANQAANDLKESPAADPQAKPGKKPTENKVAEALEQAEKHLRQTAEKLQQEKTDPQVAKDPQTRQQIDREMKQSRQQLQQAKRDLEQELAQSGSPQQARQQAAKRQEELRQEAQSLRQDMQQAQQRGDISKQQQQAADKAMQQAQQKMQQAQKSLQQNRQSQAAQQQQQAADAIDRATEQMQKNRPLSDEQKQQLKQQSKEQKKLAEDIMKLAELAEKRKNQRALQALDDAGKAAEEAAEKLDQGEDDQAEEKQEEAREKLEEAKKALEEERERYEDLRQEELLFKIRDELQQFLAKQEPITEKTSKAGKELAAKGRLSRRGRRRLNELAEQEKELSAKARFLREALEKESVLVFSHALQTNEQDLAEVNRRLAGRRPNPDVVTVVLQQDVETRTRHLLEALKREQERRKRQQKKDQEQKQQQDEQPDRQNNQQNRRRRLVSITAELEMLKQMEEDMMKRTKFMEKLIKLRGEDVSELDLALLERLAHRHNRVTEIFLELKKQIEDILSPPQPEADEKPKEPGKGGGK